MQPIQYSKGSLKLLNQKLLPGETIFEDSSTAEKTFDAIRDMKVRGAPAIAISALLGLAAEVYGPLSEIQAGKEVPCYNTLEDAYATLLRKLDYLFQSRPTAVNLGNAIAECKEHLAKKRKELVNENQQTDEPAAKLPKIDQSQEIAALLETFIEFAEAYYQKDVAINKAIGKFGSEHILKYCSKGSPKIRILTHCNTGALATTQYGTALGVIRFVQEAGTLERIYCTETRPYNQGARLTAYECVNEGMNTTLIVDSSVSYLMQQQQVHAVVVGADRVCNNGDTANKIGTYQIAVTAKHHGVPFFVAVPSTTLDLTLADGSGIHIEERPTEEITHNAQTGARVVVDGPNLSVWNPSFDLTPAALISGIFTERGVILPDEAGKYDVKKWFQSLESASE